MIHTLIFSTHLDFEQSQPRYFGSLPAKGIVDAATGLISNNCLPLLIRAVELDFGTNLRVQHLHDGMAVLEENFSLRDDTIISEVIELENKFLSINLTAPAV
jgi:hypothetical protein